MQQASDFREECEALYDLLKGLDETDFTRETQFKQWTIDDIVGHLHYFNLAVEISFEGDDVFMESMAPLFVAMGSGKSMVEVQWEKFGDLRGKALVEAWIEGSRRIADTYAGLDPKTRLSWFGPTMSARSSVTARQMETWAHSQAIYDLLGLDREEGDRLRNIAHLSASTIPFAFRLRGMEVPEPLPYVCLTSPSGETWEWNDPDSTNQIKGTAVEFCQVSAQTRNIQDTGLEVSGDGAQAWAAIAQCFAGAPVEPPAPGTRFKQIAG